MPIDWVEESTPELTRLRCKKDVTIPVSQIDRVVEGTNYPKLDKQAVESLDTIPLRRRSIWDRASDTELEPVLFAFGEQATADEGVQALKRLDKEWSTKAFAAVLTKDQMERLL